VVRAGLVARFLHRATTVMPNRSIDRTASHALHRAIGLVKTEHVVLLQMELPST
jgi:hypothetical protein